MNKEISILKSIIDEFQINSLIRQFEIINNLIANNKIIDIAVLGQFKSGKSSFINHLIGINLLPVGIIPVTSVITRISYGANEKALIKFKNGVEKVTELKYITEYINESKNPDNKKKVLLVDVFLPTLERFKGIRIVDTPGIGSYHIHNTLATKEWMPEVGISILAISTERPLSENEVNLLKEIIPYSSKIIIVLTKTDLLTISQLREVKDYIVSAIKNEFGRSFPLFDYSIYSESDSCRSKILKDIIETLANNFDSELHGIIDNKIRSLKKEAKKYLVLLKQSSLNTESEKLEIKKKIIDEGTNIEFLSRELSLIADNYTEQTRQVLVEFLNQFHPILTAKIENEFDKEFKNSKLHLGKLTQKFEEWIEQKLRTELFELSEENHYKLLINLKKAQEHFSNYMSMFSQMLNQNIEKVLGIKFEKSDWNIDIGEIRQPDIRIKKPFDFHLDLIWFFFPMALFRNIFIRHFKKEIPYLIEINLSRLASDYTERINKEIIKLERQAARLILDEIKTIESLLLKKDNNIARIDELIKKLSQN